MKTFILIFAIFIVYLLDSSIGFDFGSLGDKIILEMMFGNISSKRGRLKKYNRITLHTRMKLITNFAYRIISDTYTEGEKCVLHELHILPFPILAIPVRKYSPYKEIVAKKVLWQREVGVTDRIGNLWIPAKPNCDAKAGAEFASVRLVEFSFPLWLVGSGALLSVSLFLFEIVCHNFLEKQKKKKERQSLPPTPWYERKWYMAHSNGEEKD